MKNFSWFWNLIHHRLYLFETAVFRGISLLCFPSRLLDKTTFMKKKYAKYGIADPNKFINYMGINPEFGQSSIWAGIHVGGLLVLLEFGIFNFIQLLVGRPLIGYVWGNGSFFRALFLVVLLIPPGIINYSVLFNDDRYLAYFKKFEAESPSEKRKHTWLAVFTILAIWVFVVGSFVALCTWGATRISSK